MNDAQQLLGLWYQNNINHNNQYIMRIRLPSRETTNILAHFSGLGPPQHHFPILGWISLFRQIIQPIAHFYRAKQAL
jgi:hypothetical protein